VVGRECRQAARRTRRTSDGRDPDTSLTAACRRDPHTSDVDMVDAAVFKRMGAVTAASLSRCVRPV
jgi:hypothetical protein